MQVVGATPPVDSAVVRALLEQQAPHLAALPLRPLPGGADNAVVRLGDRLLVRLPRTPASAVLLAHEQRWLPELAPALPLPVPVPLVAGRPGAGFPHPWSVVPWLDGATADAAPYDPAALAVALREVLLALHRPAPPDAPGNPHRGVPLTARLERFGRAVAGHPGATRLVQELTGLARVPGPPGPALWVHGDLHPRNVVVRDGRLAGLIDFGDLHAGDRAVDLAGLWMLLPAPLRDRLRRELTVDDDTWLRARGWALALGSALRELGVREGDEAFRQLGDRTLEEACPR